MSAKPTTLEQIRISGKNLGAMALPTFCPRCSWIKLKLQNRLPFQIFPGIFSSIDAYTKHVVHGYFDAHGTAPPWLADLGDIVGYREPPSWHYFNALIDDHNILLTGAADGILVRSDRSHLIVDYKTARFTAAQDELLPMYEVQLNAYAMLGNACGFNPVTGLALIYMQPMTGPSVDAAAMCDDAGFLMGFSAHIRHVDLDLARLEPLFARTRELYEMPAPPAGRDGCQDCANTGRLAATLPIGQPME